MLPPDLGKDRIRRYERQIEDRERKRLADRPWELENNPMVRHRRDSWFKLLALVLLVVAFVVLVWVMSLTAE